MKKRWFFLIIFFVVIAVLAGWAQYRNGQNQPQAPTPVPTPESVQTLPSVLNFPNIPQGARFTYDGPQKSVPESLPTYQTGLDMTISDLNSLASRVSGQLGLTATPSSAILNGNFIYAVDQDSLSFHLTKSKATTSLYYQRLLATGAPASSIPGDKIAGDLMTSLNVFPSPYVISPLGQQTELKEDVAVGDIPPPTLYQYGFGVSLGNIRVIAPGYSVRWGLIVVDQNGIVRLIKATIPYLSPTEANTVRIISLDSAVYNLNGGRGVLVSFSNADPNSPDTSPVFMKGTLSDFSIVYANITGRLVPAYLFSGIGQSQEGKTQSFEVLVLASPQ